MRRPSRARHQVAAPAAAGGRGGDDRRDARPRSVLRFRRHVLREVSRHLRAHGERQGSGRRGHRCPAAAGGRPGLPAQHGRTALARRQQGAGALCRRGIGRNDGRGVADRASQWRASRRKARLMNDMPIEPAGLFASDEVRAVHAGVLALDSHIDIPWPDGPAFAEPSWRRVELPKLKRGGIGAAFFAAYVPQGPRTPTAEGEAFDRACAMLRAIARMGECPGARHATTADEIEQASRDGVVAIVGCVENGYAIGTDLRRLETLRALGARYLTITHNGHNALADSAIARADLHDPPALHGGLSPLGRAAIPVLNRLGMLADVSHLAREAALEVASISRAPVVATHSCVRALRDPGGVVQITAVSGFLRLRAKETEVTVGDVVDHIDHAVGRIGIAHVGIGSDFDGGGAVVGWRDASESANVTAELLRRGYDRRDVAALWGGNMLRVLRAAEAIAED